MAVRLGRVDVLTTLGRGVATGYVGRRSPLVDEDEQRRIYRRELLTPCLVLGFQLGTVLLGVAERLFFRVIASRLNARSTAEVLLVTPAATASCFRLAPGSTATAFRNRTPPLEQSADPRFAYSESLGNLRPGVNPFVAGRDGLLSQVQRVSSHPPCLP